MDADAAEVLVENRFANGWCCRYCCNREPSKRQVIVEVSVRAALEPQADIRSPLAAEGNVGQYDAACLVVAVCSDVIADRNDWLRYVRRNKAVG